MYFTVLLYLLLPQVSPVQLQPEPVPRPGQRPLQLQVSQVGHCPVQRHWTVQAPSCTQSSLTLPCPLSLPVQSSLPTILPSPSSLDLHRTSSDAELMARDGQELMATETEGQQQQQQQGGNSQESPRPTFPQVMEKHMDML